MQAPPKKSLHKLSLDNPWFLTHPLFWTTPHLELLDCHFQSIDDAPSDATESVGGEGSIDQGIWAGQHDTAEHDQVFTQLAETFAKSFSPIMKSHHISNLLAHNGSALKEARNPPAFFFANRPVEKLNCTIFHHRIAGQHQDNLPLIGYFHYQTLVRKRREKLTPRPHPDRGNNGPVRRMYQRKLSQVTPEQWSRDPYLVCILLSLAQSQARTSQLPQPSIFVVRLLVTTKADLTFVHLFEAEITSKLLETLDIPTLSMKHVSWPTIKHTKIPLEPYSNFRARIIGHLLGARNTLRIEPTAVGDSKAIAEHANKRKLEEENDQT